MPLHVRGWTPSSRRRSPLLLIALFGVAGCALPPAASVAPADLEAEIAARPDALVVDPTQPASPEEAAAFWQACIERYAPEVRAAKERLAAAQARTRSLGAPAAAMLDASTVGSGSDRETELMLALDLPGLLGAGRSGAARALAAVDVELAQAELDRARFVAGLRLRRAQASLAATRRRDTALTTLIEETADGVRRTELLEGRGWLPPNQVAQARTMTHHLGAARTEERARLAERRAELAAAAGLPSNAAMLDAELTGLLSPGPLATSHGNVAALLQTQPLVRTKRLEYTRAEAQVRTAAAERWPALLVGPKLKWTADDLMLGGLLRLELPWPGGAQAEVDAALRERDAARAALVDALVEAQARIAATAGRRQRAQESAALHSDLLDQESGAAWRAARARFAIDAALLPDWSMALEQRQTAVLAVADAWEARELAEFDLLEALGPEEATR